MLATVTVDERGVAHSVDENLGLETLLAAVRIDDAKNATLIPFENSDGELILPVSNEKPTRIGFFIGVGWRGLRSGFQSEDASVVLRTGLYPGVPLTTDSITDDKMREIMYKLGGIKLSEKDEERWAGQVGLFEALRFHPPASRGVFNRSHRADPSSDNWQNSPLVIVPDDLRDMLEHYDEKRVRKDQLQILAYALDSGTPDSYAVLLGSSLRGGDRFGLDARSFKGGMRGVGLGFGKAVSHQAATSRAEVSSLTGAFNIHIVPQSAE